MGLDRVEQNRPNQIAHQETDEEERNKKHAIIQRGNTHISMCHDTSCRVCCVLFSLVCARLFVSLVLTPLVEDGFFVCTRLVTMKPFLSPTAIPDMV